MISYRKGKPKDFDYTFRVKVNSTKQLVEKIWGWDYDVQLNYHKNQFDHKNIKIILKDQQEVGYISILSDTGICFIENIIIDKPYQGENIGTNVLIDTIEFGLENNKSIELQVLKINLQAKRLYEKLNFRIFAETELHYKMRYEEFSSKKISPNAQGH